MQAFGALRIVRDAHSVRGAIIPTHVSTLLSKTSEKRREVYEAVRMIVNYFYRDFYSIASNQLKRSPKERVVIT